MALKIIETIFQFIILIFVIDMRFTIPYNFLFFLFDLWFIVMFALEAFLPEKYLKHPFFEEEKFNTNTLRILTVISLLIIWQQWDFVTEKLPFLKEIFM